MPRDTGGRGATPRPANNTIHLSPSVPPAGDVRLSGTVRVLVERSADWPWNPPDVTGWVPSGLGLGALVDLGELEHLGENTIRKLADAVRHASRISVVGDHARMVATVVAELPAAIAQARAWDRAREAVPA